MIKSKKETLDKIRKLKIAFEKEEIPHLHEHEVHPPLAKDDRINYVYFTLPVALNYQRNSPAMWRSALETYNDPETNYLFFPEKVVQNSFETIQSSLIKHKLGLQKNKHTQIWLKLSDTLNKSYNNDPREIINECNNTVASIKDLLQTTRKKDFPYLSGSKMANYWLYILRQYTDIQLQDIEMITIIPDTHVLQSSIRLGISTKEDSREVVAEKWFELLEGSEIIPIDMHPVLWNWSRNGFKPEV